MAINRKGTITASTQRACVGSLAAHLDKFAEFLVGEGYVSETIKAKYALVADLSHWLKQRGVPLAKLDETRLKQFHAHRRGSRRRGDVSTGHQLLYSFPFPFLFFPFSVVFALALVRGLGFSALSVCHAAQCRP